MATRPSEADIKLRIANIISDAEDRMFERFDELHKREIHDNDVIGYLRGEGMEGLAKRYAEWGDLVVVFDEDNTTMNPDAVTDPGDAGSYKLLTPASGTMIRTIEQLALLRDGVVLWTNGGKAGQIRRDEITHHLSIAGWDGWMTLTREDDAGNWQPVGAEERRGIATYLPAVIMGVVE